MEINAGQFEKILCEGSLDIRGDGRAGSGILLAMQSLAMVAIGDPTLYVQEWPFFSAARKGAPTRGFLRLSRRPIEKSSNILSPQISILMDEGVAKRVDFAEGSLRGGIYILNTGRPPKEVAKKYRLTGRVYTIDGDKLGEKYLKKPIGNISIFALLVDILPFFDLKAAREKLCQMLQKRRLPEALIQANGDLFDASVGGARFADCDEAGPKDHVAAPFQGYGKLTPGGQSPLRLSKTHFTSSYAKIGWRLKFADPLNLCNGCGYCIINCPENIILFEPDAETGVKVKGADVERYCKLCRECITVCPKKLFSEEKIPVEDFQ
ncbi:MAG: 2-oxoacid:acceptor oxidoreductase family protein [Deltaproteobacteria bacterium]|nr:2-oxoacid:acceptor oxidoreductase family protein [Deltaproteobacteria bacterium]